MPHNYTKITKEVADKITGIAVKQLVAGIRFKQERVKQIEKNVESYVNKVKPALTGRFNIPLPTMSGMVDTVLSKIDDAPKLIWRNIREQDFKKAQKIQALWEVDQRAGRWGQKDRQVKKLAILSGRAIYKIWSESNPSYKSNLDVIHYKDFVCEPTGGSYLEDHLYLGQINIFKTDYDLDTGVEMDVYDKKQVARLKAGSNNHDFKQNNDLYKDQLESFKALGLNENINNYTGQRIFNLTEWFMVFEGKRYYLLFDHNSQIWIRCEYLSDVFESNLYPFVSWATHEDAKNFWSKGYADDFRAMSETVRVLLNQELDNRQKRNWGQKLVNTQLVDDLNLLEWRPDGIVPVTPRAGQSMDNAIKIVETPELRGSLELITWLTSFWGQQSGVTADAQGAGDSDAKVSVYFGNLQQIADRLGLVNKSYNEGWVDLGIRYDWGLYEHLSGEQAVKVIGIKGVEWEDVKPEDVEPDFDIIVVGGNAEAQLDEIKRRTKIDAITAISTNPNLVSNVSPKWLTQQLLLNGGYEEEEVKVALDTENEGNQEILAESAGVIQAILNGEQPKMNRGANTAFIGKIIDFAYDNELDEEVFNNLLNYANLHMQVALQNALRKAQSILARQGQRLPDVDERNPSNPVSNPAIQNPAELTGGEPVPATQSGVLSNAQNISNYLRP